MEGIRFHSGGPTIPYGLITAQEDGDVVFLCGAGVSMGPPIWLPGFGQLVEQIYDELGEDWSAHPGEAEGMDCPPEFIAPDRTLNALFRRLKGQEDRINDTLTNALTTNYKGTPFHHNLMKLSRGDDGSVRLVTTNFDLLFEKSWRKFENADRLASHAAAGMPGPGAAEWSGVFHLHGRLADPAFPELDATQLVLTSAQFGDAYLRTGWASRYLYDLLRHTNVVIVGYSLNDPPLRYLIDALDADRDRFDFKQLFAIAPIQHGDETKTSAVWEARGTIPLLYDPVNPDSGNTDHKALRESIKSWAAYADDPTSWARSSLAKHFRRSFDDIDEQDWSEITWILGRQDSARILQEANPTSRWLPKLLAHRSGPRAKLELGPWISERLNDRDMVDSILENQGALTPATCRQVEHKILADPAKFSPTRRAFWFGLIDGVPTDPIGLAENSYRARRLIGKATDYGYFTRRAIADWFRPKLSLDKKFSSGERKGARLSDLASLEFRADADLSDIKTVTSRWPSKLDPQLAEHLSADLSNGLSQREELNPQAISSLFDLPSISEHKQNAFRHGFAPLVQLLMRIVERMAASSPGTVRQLAEKWKHSRFALERRMWLHCLRQSSFTPEEAADEVLRLSEQDFWHVEYEREIMQLAIAIWPHLSAAKRESLEARFVQGPNGNG